MASVLESVCTNKCKGDGQRELQEEAGKSKKKGSIAASISKLVKKIILLYVEAIVEMNARNAIVAVLIDISIARGGKNDVTNTSSPKIIKKNITWVKRNQRITIFMVKKPKERINLLMPKKICNVRNEEQLAV